METIGFTLRAVHRCSMKESVCFPNRAAKIKPVSDAKLIPVQQSPTLNSSARQFFCFFRRMTTFCHQ